jgi:hypothetical protein
MKRLTRATRKGKSKLAAQQENFAEQCIPSLLHAAKSLIGRALPKEAA